ncbi:hypothetical protein BC833DRAFT_611979 [Globomyces pollinis-pini]|nr:hypothetical protein BC833DRAFT_611979 [Globomyces pollinis-pini]
MAPGKWTADDDTTWHCSCVFGFFWIFTIFVETSIRYKFNAFWNVVILATITSLIKNVIVIKYSEMVRWFADDPVKLAFGYQLYSSFEIVNIFQHVLKCLGMFQRKQAVIPSKSYADHVVLVVTTLISIGASIFCLVAPGVTCWGWSSPTLAIALMITVGYFDFYYVYLVVSKYDAKNNQREILQVLMPSIWTALNSTVYAVCSLIYRQGGADFYVNSIWNFTSVLIPLVTIQSCISTNVGAFVKNQSVGKTAGHTSEKKSVANKE